MALGVAVKGPRLASATCCAFPQAATKCICKPYIYVYCVCVCVYRDMCAHTHDQPRIHPRKHTHTHWGSRHAAYAPINKHKLSLSLSLSRSLPLSPSLFHSLPFPLTFFYTCHKQQFFILFTCFPCLPASASAPSAFHALCILSFGQRLVCGRLGVAGHTMWPYYCCCCCCQCWLNCAKFEVLFAWTTLLASLLLLLCGSTRWNKENLTQKLCTQWPNRYWNG